MAGRHWLGLKALGAAIVLCSCGNAPSSTAAASPHPSPEPSISSASLLAYTAKGPDLGPGWTDSPAADGPSLAIDNEGHPCKEAYGSDSQRLARNEVTIRNANDPTQVSNEVTVYRGDGAQNALKDTRRVLAKCAHYTTENNDGHVVAVEVHESAANLSQVGDDRVLFDRKATLDGRSIYSVVFTVRVGKYLTTIYTISDDPARAGRLAGLAAAASTIRLKTAPPS
jgi:hypothetical protein